jgi:hypothetical protein
MIVTAVAYANEEETALKVTTSDTGVINVPWPCQTWHKGPIDVWLAEQGHSIGAWVDPTDWMSRLRQTRDQKIDEIYWRVERNYSQVEHSETPSDDASKMAAIYAYLKDLRDFPANNPITTKAQYAALTWPTKPA